MNNEAERDELAKDIYFADNNMASADALESEWAALNGSTWFGGTYAHNIADGLIAKGYRKVSA